MMKKTISKGWILLLMALSMSSMCACSREESGFATDQEIGVNDGGEQIESTNENDNNGSAADVTETINLYIIEPPMAIDQTAADMESQEVVDTISRMPVSDLEKAVTYTMNGEKPFSEDHVVLLCQSETGKTVVYGYESDAYGSRGIIVGFNDKYSYYDYVWSRAWGRMDLYEQDFDHDGAAECVFCFGGAHGTGISTERLVMFDDIEGDGTFTAYEFTPKMQLEQFEQNLLFTMDLEGKKLIVAKDGKTEKSIDWEKFEDQAVGDTFGIDCLNQIWFEINGDEIRMGAGIGILFNVVGGPAQFPEDNELYLDVIYSNGVFQIQ